MKQIDIPGYDGRYYVREDGTVWRRFKKRPDKQLVGTRDRRNRYFKLATGNGRCRYIAMSKIMKLTFFRNITEGWGLMHINGLEADWSVVNLKPISKQDLGKLRNRNLTARTVIKRDPETMEIVAFYRSAREAGRENYVSYQAILDACNKANVRRKGIAPDDYIYEWER